jgi:PKD repeat protein
MKRFVWLAFLALMLTFTGRAQTPTFEVTGYVMDYSNPVPVPVPNQPVDITVDSTGNGFGYQNTVFTNDQGFYIDYIYLPPEVSMAIVSAATFDQCLGTYQVQTVFWAPGVQFGPLNFNLCDNTPLECQAMFYWETDPANTRSLQFFNTSYGDYTFSAWDFGDGTTSTQHDPLHTYAEGGFYLVTLTISDSMNTCTSTITEYVQVGQTVVGCENYFYYFFQDSLTAEFTGFLIDSMYTALSYEWDFGDGTYGTGQTVTHTFSMNPNGWNVFIVCLTTVATDYTGVTCTSVSCQEVYLGFPPPPSPCESYFIPMNFTSLTVDFEGFTLSQFPTEYTWDFGDNTTGTGQAVSHTYPQEGIYFVNLHTVDANGCAFDYGMEVWVGTFPIGCDNWFYYTQEDSLTFSFTGEHYWYDSTNVVQTEYFWDFGDGTTGYGQNITHTFNGNPANGGSVYLVCLSTSSYTADGDSCFAYSCQEVWISSNPSFAIFGTVILTNGVVADDATVRLMTTDSTWQGVFEVAAVNTSQNGFFQFDSIPLYNYRFYYLQAELNEGSAWYGDYLPTYYISALNWQEATPVMPLNNWPFDIFMIPGTTTSTGNGMIYGNVTSMSRSILQNVEVILMSEDMEPYIYARSDENGEFSFEDLAYGNYMIYAEIMGIQTTPVMITLSESQSQATVEIQVQDSEANYVVFGVTENLKLLSGVGQPYPNPTNGNITVAVTANQPVQLDLILYNQVGQMAWTGAIQLGAGTYDIPVSLEGLSSGFYYLKATTAQGDYVSRRIIKNR